MISILAKLIAISDRLDRRGLYKEADAIDEIIEEEGIGNVNVMHDKMFDIMKKMNATFEATGDFPEAISSGTRDEEKITLKFSDGSTETITGNEWDQIQVAMGLM